ncbi:hybrid sensor histidine kinase/response regulator [Pseudanabaena sp. FACHB-2040]|uniref:hybrid sensor histidine kinase/response regulator n=1 Tax=Pseudanabaena sp. FACHB-2040 TaxID=2692859 RepID=UPI0016846393|nr:hybrid sensor histidine kinase/response regulator [Pseudanabaena sp. FACHB-2040]MBD2258019.1 hybrid sensor histidine kinase/response regulator [Pseudanabaena sp. FACHB-2040]
MAQDKELEIRLQFLDEAQEYLETLESRLLGLAQVVEAEKINEALRAAHSIKGGAGLMGFQTLSDLAHRLEDGLKVLKIQRGSVTVDASLEQLLLRCIDCMGRVIASDRPQSQSGGRANELPPDWLEKEANPLFLQLHERLGEPQEEDAHSMLSPEDGQDIIPLLFETEVEGCLQRLESVLDRQDPRLKEEVAILAQELEGLGEMLQIEAFVQLCQSIAQQIESVNDDQIVSVAQASLQVWRRTQALVVTGNLATIPNALPLSQVEVAESLNLTESLGLTDSFDAAESFALTDNFDAAESFNADSFDAEGFEAESLDTENLNLADSFDAVESLGLTDSFDAADSTPAAASELDLPTDTLEADLAQWLAAEAAEAAANQPTEVQAISRPEPAVNTAWTEAPTPTETLQENTVRVPVLQINQLSDLFGELTIERNRLELEVKRLRDLVMNLQDRLRVMDQINGELRSAYDRVATQTTNSALQQPLLAAAAEREVAHNGHTLTLLEESLSQTTIRDQFDVLELDRYRDVHLPFRETIETIVQLQEVGADIDLSLDNTEQTCRDLRKTARQLQKNLTQLRMRPLSDTFDRFPRALRQMSLQYGKPVDLKIQGGRTLVDRNVLEALQEPLTHIIRNCFDHGIEDSETRLAQGKSAKGLIEIRAYQQSSRTLITIRDDGGGIDTEKIRAKARQMGLDEGLLSAASNQELLSLIFEPGFSTAGRVTDLSGRGIGMDVVRSRLKDIRGDIQVDTQPGLGTTFTLSIPYTLSVTRVLVVESHGMRMAFPVDAIEELLLLASEQIMSTAGKEMFEWEDQIVQLVPLARWLVFNCPVQLETPEIAPTISAPTVLLVEHNGRLVGIQVERSWGEQEVAIRRIEGNLPMPPGFNSCTILGDGQVVPLVNVPELLYWVASLEVNGDSKQPNQPVSNRPAMAGYLPASEAAGTPFQGTMLKRPQRPTILVIDDSINVRRLLALTLEKAGYQVAQAKDGQDALDKLNAGLTVNAVLCDVEMPRLDGYGFLAQIKAQPVHDLLPVAMLTSRGSEKHRQLAANLGAAAYFTKPYNEQFLLKTLAALVEQAVVS